MYKVYTVLIMMSFKFKEIVVLSFGIAIRLCLIYMNSSQLFADRIEVVSPLTSKKKVTECISLVIYGLSPYASDICHQPPLVILLLKNVRTTWLFLVVDILTAILLHRCAYKFNELMLKQQELNKHCYAQDISSLLLTDVMLAPTAFVVMTMYLLNPYSIMTFSAESTIILNNFVNAAIFLTCINEWFGVAACLVSLSSYLSIYGMMFILPVLLHSYNSKSSRCGIVVTIVYPLLTALIAASLLLTLSHQVFYSWDFLNAVYGFTFQVSELTPNMGLFWYFFLEMFDHFRTFFLWVFQINVFIYFIPLTIIFRKQSFLLFYILLSLITLLKSYSNMADLALPLSMLPLWGYVYKYLRNVLFITALFIVSSVLAPVMWYLWIYAGSGNANFFYAVTLAYSSAQIFLLSDILYAVLRRQYHLKHGLQPKRLDGQTGQVIMK